MNTFKVTNTSERQQPLAEAYGSAIRACWPKWGVHHYTCSRSMSPYKLAGATIPSHPAVRAHVRSDSSDTSPACKDVSRPSGCVRVCCAMASGAVRWGAFHLNQLTAALLSFLDTNNVFLFLISLM